MRFTWAPGEVFVVNEFTNSAEIPFPFSLFGLTFFPFWAYAAPQMWREGEGGGNIRWSDFWAQALGINRAGGRTNPLEDWLG